MKNEGVKTMQIIIVVLLVILAVCLGFYGAQKAKKPKTVVHEKIVVQEKVDQEEKLYNDHAAFIKKVKEQLRVPESPDITYSVGEPYYAKVYESEMVYVYFEQSGEIVASAGCDTTTGELINSILNYQPPETERRKITGETVPETYEYMSYHNDRFGYTIEYPDFLTPGIVPDNGAGRTFESADGLVKLTASGSHAPGALEDTDTLDGYYSFIKSNLDYTPTYEAKKEDNFIFTGIKGDKIIYERHYMKDDLTENCFYLEYPVSQKEKFDSIVEHIVDTFETGTGWDSTTES